MDISIKSVPIQVDQTQELSDAAEALFYKKLKGLFPFVPVSLQMIIKGVPTSIVHTLRRVLIDEVPTFRLQCPPPQIGGDPFMTANFICQRIELIPLKVDLQLAQANKIEFKLTVVNNSFLVKTIYSGDLVQVLGPKEVIFNPTFELGFVQPGQYVTIEGIRITSGTGLEHSRFCAAVRGRFRHLDLKETNFDVDNDQKKSHLAAKSGYSTPTLLTDSQEHFAEVIVHAAPVQFPEVAKNVIITACNIITSRLRKINDFMLSLESQNVIIPQFKFLTENQKNSVKCTLTISESHTIGNCLTQALYTPTIGYVGYSAVQHKNTIDVIIRGESYEFIRNHILQTLTKLIQVYDKIKAGV